MPTPAIVPPVPQASPPVTPMATKVELKAALPADFSGEPAEAMRWIKAMKAYYVLNATIYSTEDAQIMTALNKMSKG
jgi:hypothetical protein